MDKGKSILITGGTGSFGQECVRYLLTSASPSRIIIFSRDELKQEEMRKHLNEDNLRYFLGDVRDADRLREAMADVDYVIHAAALKQVPSAEYNPMECIKTNIHGAENVIRASLENKVEKVVALSTDKAVNPINLYGATKLASDKLFTAANNIVGAKRKTRFAVVRYGNVVGSRGSVVPLFREMVTNKSDHIPITHPDMTRFWISLQDGVEFVIKAFSRMSGGEIFVPKSPSVRIVDLAKAMAPKLPIEIIGIRPGEKIHEVMISSDDALNTLEFESHYVIQPAHPWWDNLKYIKIKGGKTVENDFVYSSDNNSDWLSVERLKKYIAEL